MDRLKKIALTAFTLSTVLLICQWGVLPQCRAIFYKKQAKKELFTNFINYSMIRYYGIYTLYGMKPITEFDIQYKPSSKRELKKRYRNLPKEEKKKLSFEKFAYGLPWSTSIEEQWKSFKEKLGRLDSKEYFFVENRYNYDDEYFTSVLFVHQPSLLEVLETYHEQFESETGERFNSVQKVLELKNGGSRFWNKIFKDKNHYLMGLVFGFGEENSKCFQLEMDGDTNIEKRRVHHTTDEEIRRSFKEKVTIEDLCLPAFITYPQNIEDRDEVVETYRRNRKFIINNLKGKNLEVEVFQHLRNQK